MEIALQKGPLPSVTGRSPGSGGGERNITWNKDRDRRRRAPAGGARKGLQHHVKGRSGEQQGGGEVPGKGKGGSTPGVGEKQSLRPVQEGKISFEGWSLRRNGDSSKVKNLSQEKKASSGRAARTKSIWKRRGLDRLRIKFRWGDKRGIEQKKRKGNL